jgi:hypothetical protein
METKQIEIIQRIYKSLAHSMITAHAEVPNAWLKQRKLSFVLTGAGFCSGQLHHRKPEEFILELESVGFLRTALKKNDARKYSHNCFGKYSMIFPLRDEQKRIVNFYAIGVKNGKTEYLNEEGIYPAHPPSDTQRLFIMNDILDAATMLEAKVLKEGESMMALFDGEYKPQHMEVLKRLAGKTKEIIFIKKDQIKKEAK